MTEDIVTGEKSPEDRDGFENSWPIPKGRDWLLASIVELVAMGLEVGMTLSIHGLTVSGVVISAKTYLEESAAKVRSSVSSEYGKMIGDFFEGYVPLHEKPPNAPADYRAPPPNYIHMRSPTFLAPNGGTSIIHDTLWRWRLSEVDGFSLSQIGPSSDRT